MLNKVKKIQRCNQTNVTDDTAYKSTHMLRQKLIGCFLFYLFEKFYEQSSINLLSNPDNRQIN